MIVAIDKTVIDKIKDFTNNEYVYIFDEEDVNYLCSLGIKCVNYKFFDYCDINLSSYVINCLKKANIDDSDWNKPIEKKKYKYAIIVPSYNNNHGDYKGKTYLRNCIDSILSQSYKDFELIIVDDCSTDDSVATICEYIEKDKRVHLINNTRKRYNGGSRNVGIDYALEHFEFDYFCFLDSDDWWKDDKVLELIDRNMFDYDLMLIGLECIDENGVFLHKLHEYDNYKDFFLSDNKVWCTAWARVIKKEKIVYFCEDTLMEDRVWSYRQADNVDFNKVKNLKKVMYVWNRMNRNNSVSLVRNDYWDASAWCHIGHQKQLLANLKHKEMKPILEDRIRTCINKVIREKYEQY